MSENIPNATGSPMHDSCTRDELRDAIATNELALYYQPTVSLSDGIVSGFEALVRWPHPRFGLLGAADLVPWAEHWDLVEALDDWGLATACRELATWQEDVLVAPGFRMAVNVGGSEVDGTHLVDRVRHAVNVSGVDARGLVIEITESCPMKSITAAQESAAGLHALGVEVSLDDFGSQYSNFARLSALPFDVLKIDREFVVATDTRVGRAFVRALVDLGDNLGARVIAEGIETTEQAAHARALGAHEGQGFLWAPALSAEKVRILLTTGVWPERDLEASWYPSFASAGAPHAHGR